MAPVSDNNGCAGQRMAAGITGEAFFRLMAVPSIHDLPGKDQMVRFKPGFGQRFIVTVDTEEEFRWDQPLARTGHTLETVSRLRDFQKFCDGYGVKPVYLVDYPIAESAEAVAVLRDLVADSGAEVGIQLHPWVNPPFEEEVNQFNSFAGNLPNALETQKFTGLVETIRNNIGVEPRMYRAGRYGAGPSTAAMMCAMMAQGTLGAGGLVIDSSVRTKFDYSYAGGPDYRAQSLHPWWINREARLVELPLTTIFWGVFRKFGDFLYPRLWRWPWMRGALAELAVMERISLSPEGIPVREALKAIDIAVKDQLPILNFSFHSPSLSPGYTPYVRSEADLEKFYDWWRIVLDYLAMKGIQAASIDEVVAAIER